MKTLSIEKEVTISVPTTNALAVAQRAFNLTFCSKHSINFKQIVIDKVTIIPLNDPVSKDIKVTAQSIEVFSGATLISLVTEPVCHNSGEIEPMSIKIKCLDQTQAMVLVQLGDYPKGRSSILIDAHFTVEEE